MPIRIQEDVFLPLALPTDGHGPCEKCEMTVSTENDLDMHFFWQSKIYFLRRPLIVPREHWAVVGWSFGNYGSMFKAMGSHVELTRPS